MHNHYFKELNRLYTLYRPYFTLSGKGLHRTVGALAIIACNLISALSMISIQNAFSALNLILMSPGITLPLITSSLLSCITPIIVFAGFISFSYTISSWLSDNLTHELNQ